MAICYQYAESAYFPAPYADNQLFCSLCSPKRSHAFNFCGLQTQQPDLAVGRPTFAISPKITPETISEGQKSKIFWGGHAPTCPTHPESPRSKFAVVGLRERLAHHASLLRVYMCKVRHGTQQSCGCLEDEERNCK